MEETPGKDKEGATTGLRDGSTIETAVKVAAVDQEGALEGEASTLHAGIGEVLQLALRMRTKLVHELHRP